MLLPNKATTLKVPDKAATLEVSAKETNLAVGVLTCLFLSFSISLLITHSVGAAAIISIISVFIAIITTAEFNLDDNNDYNYRYNKIHKKKK